MLRILLLVLGIILTCISIILVANRQSAAAAVVSSIFAMLAFFVSLYPNIYNQPRIEPNIVLNDHNLNLISTDEYDLKTVIFPDDYDIKWDSDNTNIVTVDNKGHLKAIDEGNATIMATVFCNGIEYTDVCNVTVKNPTINLNSPYSLSIGETGSLLASTIPENVSILWSSSNPEIVSVNDSGKVKGLSEGTATITATMTYNNIFYSAVGDITVEKDIEEKDIEKKDKIELDMSEAIDSETTQNNDSQESGGNIISVEDVVWLDDEKIYKDAYATTMRGEKWSDCIRFGSSNINSDGTAVLRIVCDKKYSKFTAEIAPQDGFDKTESVTLYIYGATGDEQTFIEEFQIDYSTKPFKVEYDISNSDELYFWKSGNYNQGRIAGQYINGYTGMGVLMHDAILYE